MLIANNKTAPRPGQMQVVNKKTKQELLSNGTDSSWNTKLLTRDKQSRNVNHGFDCNIIPS